MLKILRNIVSYPLILPNRPRVLCSRRKLLTKILDYTNTNIPFYQGHFQGFLEQEPSMSDSDFFYAYSHLPFVTKQDLKNCNEEFTPPSLHEKVNLLDPERKLSTKRAILHGLIKKDFCTSISTGGSSGIPAFRWLDYEDANIFARSFLHSFEKNGWKQGESFVVFYPLKSYFTSTYADYARHLHTFFGFTMVPFETITKEAVETLLETLRKKNATLLVIFPCVLQRIAEIMYRENIPPFDGLKYINVSGEFFLDCSKTFIQKMFPGSDIQATYGAVEFGEIAHQYGDKSTDYQVFNDYAYIEQGPDNTMLVTTLHQKTFPLIRYQIEDMGSVTVDETGQQYIVNLEGKNTDYLIGGDGYHYYASFFNAVINEMNKAFDNSIIHFMLRHDQGSMQLNFVLQDTTKQKQIEKAALDTIHAIFPNYTKIQVRFCDYFDHDYTRKFKIIGQGDGLSEVVGGYFPQKQAS